MSLACMYCRHYRYDRDLSNVYWKVTQDNECPQIGRCTFVNKTCGNAVLATGRQSDGVGGCNAFEDMRETLKYRVGDVFEGKKGLFGIIDIQWEYRPALYRCASFNGSEWSESEENLDKYKLIWRKQDGEVDSVKNAGRDTAAG